MQSSDQHEIWASRPAFLLATIGGAVGLGNLWRFPYIAGENGAGGFVLIYVGFVFLLGLPLIAAEMMLGRRGKGSAIQTLRRLTREEGAPQAWKLVGWLSLLLPFVGLSYYAVVAAWTIDYLLLALQAAFEGLTGEQAVELFAAQIDKPVYQALLHALFMGLTVAIVARGVNRGIAQISRIMMPLLFVMLVLLVLYNVFAADFYRALTFLLAPNFSAITGESILIALGQALFSLAAGAGMLITYGAYIPKEYSLGSNAAVICVGDTIVALLAGLAIFPIVFQGGLSPAEGPGLIFVTLPIAFGQMPAGSLIAILFFFLLFFAALTTSIGMLEPIISYLIERPGVSRIKVTILSGTAIWLFGLLSVFSFNILSGVHPLGWLSLELTFFDIIDFSVANILLPVNALLLALFAGWIVSYRTSSDELATTRTLYTSWRVAIRYFVPVAITAVFIDLLT